MKNDLNRIQVKGTLVDKENDRIASFVQILYGDVELNSIWISEKTGCKYKVTGNGFISPEAYEKGIRILMLRLIDDHENQCWTLEVDEILNSPKPQAP